MPSLLIVPAAAVPLPTSTPFTYTLIVPEPPAFSTTVETKFQEPTVGLGYVICAPLDIPSPYIKYDPLYKPIRYPSPPAVLTLVS